MSVRIKPMEKDKKQPSRLESLDSGREDQDITTRFVQEELSDILARAYDGTRPVYDASTDIMQFTTRSQLISAEEKPRLSRKEKFQEPASDSQTCSQQELQALWEETDRKPEPASGKAGRKKAKKDKKDKPAKPRRSWFGRKQAESAIPETKTKEEQAPSEPEPPKRRFLTDEPPRPPRNREDQPSSSNPLDQVGGPSGASNHSTRSNPASARTQTGDAAGWLEDTDTASISSSSLDKERKPRFSKASALRGSQEADTDRLWRLEPKPAKPAWWTVWLEKYKAHLAKKTHYGWITTLALCVLLVGMISGFWALFVAGPAKMHEEKVAEAQARMVEQVPEIQGISRNVFAYITYDGYTEDTLYWFDVTGELITSKPLTTLNYEAARQKALNTYGVDTITIQLAYGYTAPVYEIQSENYLLLLDYDTLSLIYERRELT